MGQRGQLRARASWQRAGMRRRAAPELCPPEPLVKKHNSRAQGCRDWRGQRPVSTRGQPHAPPETQRRSPQQAPASQVRARQGSSAAAQGLCRWEAAGLRGREGTLPAPLLSGEAESTGKPAQPPPCSRPPAPRLRRPVPGQQLGPVTPEHICCRVPDLSPGPPRASHSLCCTRMGPGGEWALRGGFLTGDPTCTWEEPCSRLKQEFP